MTIMRLADILYKVPVNEIADTSLPVFSVTKHAGFVRSDQYFRKQVFSSDLTRYKYVAKGDFAYATIHLDEGSIGVAPEDGLISPMYTVFQVDATMVHAAYLLRYLKSPRALASYAGMGNGTVERRRSISFDALSRLEIDLPALEEQQRIAALLDQVDELRAKRRRTLALLNELRESLFRSLLNAAESPYAVVKVRELVRLRSGKFLPSKAMVTRGAVPVYGGNGVNGRHNVAMYEEPRIIIGRVGAHCGSVHVTAAKSWVTDNALICDWDENVMLLGYLAHALRYAKLNQYAATTDLRQISARRIGELPLVVPPMRIQELYVHNSYEVGKLLAHAEADLAKLDELFASLQHRAFTGRL